MAVERRVALPLLASACALVALRQTPLALSGARIVVGKLPATGGGTIRAVTRSAAPPVVVRALPGGRSVRRTPPVSGAPRGGQRGLSARGRSGLLARGRTLRPTVTCGAGRLPPRRMALTCPTSRRPTRGRGGPWALGAAGRAARGSPAWRWRYLLAPTALRPDVCAVPRARPRGSLRRARLAAASSLAGARVLAPPLRGGALTRGPPAAPATRAALARAASRPSATHVPRARQSLPLPSRRPQRHAPSAPQAFIAYCNPGSTASRSSDRIRTKALSAGPAPAATRLPNLRGCLQIRPAPRHNKPLKSGRNSRIGLESCNKPSQSGTPREGSMMKRPGTRQRGRVPGSAGSSVP